MLQIIVRNVAKLQILFLGMPIPVCQRDLFYHLHLATGVIKFDRPEEINFRFHRMAKQYVS